MSNKKRGRKPNTHRTKPWPEIREMILDGIDYDGLLNDTTGEKSRNLSTRDFKKYHRVRNFELNFYKAHGIQAATWRRIIAGQKKHPLKPAYARTVADMFNLRISDVMEKIE